MIGIISGLISMLGWGTADFLAAKTSRQIGNVLTLFWMLVCGLPIALIYFFLNFQLFDLSNVPEFLVIIVVSGFFYTIGSLAFYKGLKEGQVSLVTPIGASFALIIVILSILFFKEILETNQLAGIILIALGIILCSINIKNVLRTKKLKLFVGVKEGLTAMLGWGLSLFLIIPASKALGWFIPVLLMRLFVLLFLIFYILIREQSFRIDPRPSLLASLLAIGLLSIIAFFAYSFGVRGEYASIVAPIAAAFPLVSIILARIFLKEELVLNQNIGIASVIIGLILISL